LTGKQRCHAQANVLRKMGIRHALRPDGTPVVARAHIAALLNKYTATPTTPRTSGKVNLAALATRPRKS
jgi:ATP phosphoribosyltransferase regulatory subunit HisZ